MKTPESGIDTSFVDLANGTLGQEPKTAEELLELGKKYAVAQAPNTAQEVAPQARVLVESLKTNPTEKISTAPGVSLEKNKGNQDKAKEIARAKLFKEYPQIEGATLGQARGIIEDANNKHEFNGLDGFSVIGLSVGMGLIAMEGSTIPAFLTALAEGPTGVVTGTGIGVAGFAGVVIVAGAGFLIYEGYKLIKRVQEKRRFTKDTETLDKVWRRA